MTLQPPGRPDAATKHLCAGAYIDDRFRNRVLGEIYDRPDQAVAPNPGIKPGTVLRHLLHARTVTNTQYSVLALVFVLCLIIAGDGRVLLVMLLFFWGLVAATILTTWGSSGLSAKERTIRNGRLLAGSGVLGLLTTFLLLIQRAQAAQGNTAGGQSAAGVLLPLLILLVFNIGFGINRAGVLLDIRDGVVLTGPTPDRLKEIADTKGKPVVTYASGSHPFVGHGDPVAGWQFALPLKPKQTGAAAGAGQGPDPVRWDELDAETLCAHLKSRLRALGRKNAKTAPLPDLRTFDRLFVSGLDVSRTVYELRDLAGAIDPPVGSIAEAQGRPTAPVRHYLCCQVSTWGGELVTSAFVHCAFQGETLYVEFSSYVLHPTKLEYHVFGRQHPASPRSLALTWGALRGAALLPLVTGYSLLGLFEAMGRGVRRSVRRLAASSVERASYAKDDLGAQVGIRELGMATGKDRHAQSRDAVKYTEILERQTLEAVVDFLDERGIDVEELKTRSDAIVNYGVINYGKLNAGAIGRGAKASVGAVGDNSRGILRGATP